MRCPVRNTDWIWRSQTLDDYERTPVRSTCNEDLYLLVEGAADLDSFDPNQPVKREDLLGWCDGITWKVTCGNGHVIAVSPDPDSLPHEFCVSQIIDLGPSLKDLLVLQDIEKGLRSES